MSDSKKIAILFGQEFGAGLLPSIRFAEDQLIDDEHKLLWWAAVFGYLGGICAASIGPQSNEAIQAMTLKTTGRVLNEKSH